MFRGLAIVMLFAGVWSSFAGQEPTAFQLAKDGNRFVGEPSQDKVLEIYSEKSIASLTPSLWTVAYSTRTRVSNWSRSNLARD